MSIKASEKQHRSNALIRKFVWSSLGNQLNLFIADFSWAEFKNAKKMTSAASVPLEVSYIFFERLIAIKFTMQYSNVMTNNNLKIEVSAIWIFGFMNGIFKALKMNLALYYIGSLITISCVVFVAFAYVILYHETRRHRRKIKTQQLPQGEVERSTKENKALKTTVFVVGAVIVSLLPAGFCFIGLAKDLFDTCPINEPLWQTCVMLNSLVNPLIYCFRQKEMRKVVFRKRTQVIYPAMQC